jgi:DNA-binding response OmpR family regulator
VVVAEYLREYGLQVIEAIDAAEAMAVHASAVRIDVTLIDVATVGNMSGFELARWIRSAAPQGRVVLTSTVGSVAREVHQLCDGGAPALSHNAAALEQRLRRLLRR